MNSSSLIIDSRGLLRLLAVSVAVLVTLVFAEAARADLTLEPGAPSFTLSTDQAGAHPDVTTSFAFTTNTDEGFTRVSGSVRDTEVELPAGLVGSAGEVPRCSGAELSIGECPVDSQVGVATVYFEIFGSSVPGTAGLYNVAPQNGAPAELGFFVYGVTTPLAVEVRPDGGLTIKARNIEQALPVQATSVTVWGVPADPSHDAERYTGPFSAGASAGIPPRPFMTNPTECTGQPLQTHFSFASWERPDQELEASAAAGPITGCEKIPFNPSIDVQPRQSKAGSPSGYSVKLAIPQTDNPKGLGTANLRDAAVTLPEGVNLNPAAAGGLASCSDEDLGLGSAASPTCPDASKIAAVHLVTPALPEALGGAVYLRPQLPGDPYRVALVIEGQGVVLKVPGSVKADPETGRLTATFNDAPQQPFSEMELTLTGGQRAPLTVPRTCGEAVTTSLLTPRSSSTPATPSSAFDVSWDGHGAPCPDSLPFDPKMSAGVTNPSAGAYSPFVMRLTRSDADQRFGSIDLTLPPGQLAKLKGTTPCEGAAAASGDCPSSSQVGSAVVGAGVGDSPVFVPGTGKARTATYLGGPYKGAPLSLIVKVPAQAGPFDLGTVAVRSAVYVDPTDVHLRIVSDSLPTILEGTPLALKDIRILADRPGFMVNPTNCEPMQVSGAIGSTEGATATVANRYQLGDCAALGFRPRLSLRFLGATGRAAYPKLRAVLKARPGDANIARAVVTLPKSQFLENKHIRTVCTRVQYAADNCPKGSIYGYAKAWSPLLDQPLQGPVYLRSSDNVLPDLVASLDGQIHVDLDGRIDSVHGRMRTTFASVPDAPISKFVLQMQGGKKGLLVNSTDLCRVSPRASVEFQGQNGRSHDTSQVVRTDCRSHHSRR